MRILIALWKFVVMSLFACVLASSAVAQEDGTILSVSTPKSFTSAAIPASGEWSGVFDAQLINTYVYQRTGEVDSRSATSQVDGYVTYKNVTAEVFLLNSADHFGNEQEFNFYYDSSVKKSPIGEIKFEFVSGDYVVADGNIIHAYAEVSRDYVLPKGKITITPFVGYGNWFGFGEEMSRGYIQGGVRISAQLAPKWILTEESAVSHCVREDARMDSYDCRDVAYVNAQLKRDLGKNFAISLRMGATSGAPLFAGIALTKNF